MSAIRDCLPKIRAPFALVLRAVVEHILSRIGDPARNDPHSAKRDSRAIPSRIIILPRVKISWLLLPAYFVRSLAHAACTVSIGAPADNSTATYLTTFSATAVTCPSAVRIEFRVNGHRFLGLGQEANGYAAVSGCSTACTGLVSYNVSYLFDGGHQFTAIAWTHRGYSSDVRHSHRKGR